MNDADELIPTRDSLLSRLKDWEDSASWREFFDLYWKLIYNTARKAGLTDSDSQDVVQETLITVSRQIEEFRYNPERGSFKRWLLNTTRWRIQDQFRKRRQQRAEFMVEVGQDLALKEVSEASDDSIENHWQADWEKNMIQGAIEQTKRLIPPKHYQVFDLAVLREWPTDQIAVSLQVSSAYVYLIKHRVSARVKKELRKLHHEYQ